MKWRSTDRQLSEEMEAHLQEKIADCLDAGMSEAEARIHARREFGNATLYAEIGRDVWTWSAWERVAQDLRFALRGMRRSPAFTAVALLSLGVGIGANTAIFSVFKGLLLDPLPYRDPGRLAMLWTEDSRHNIHEEGTGYRTVQDWKQRSRSFDDLAVSTRGNSMRMTDLEPPQQVDAELVSGNLFPLLGTPPLIGRSISPEDEAGRRHVVVLSYGLWQRRFGGAANVLGRTIQLDGAPAEIVGVMPRGFFFPSESTEIWGPASMASWWDRESHRRFTDWWRVAGRLRPTVSIAAARVELNAIGQQLARENPTDDTDFAGFGVNVVPMLEQIVGRKTPLLLTVLLASVVVLLLIACSNLAQLLLARGASRQHEFAIRRALGAGRARLARQLLTESLLLALLAGGVGVFLAFTGFRALMDLAPAGIPRFNAVKIDGGVLLFTACISVAAGVLFGLAPVLGLSRREARGALGEGGRTTSSGPVQARARDILVTCEFAMGVLLLLTTMLLVRSYIRVQHVDPGYSASNVLIAHITLDRAATESEIFYPRLLERIAGLPGVRAAGTSSEFFIQRNPDLVITVEGRDSVFNGSTDGRQLIREGVSPGYFRALGVPLLAGRELTANDARKSIVIINQEMARRYWPNEDPIGKRFTDNPKAPAPPWFTVAGVVGNMRRQGRETAPIPEFYSQSWWNDEDIVIRTSSDPLRLAGALRSEVRALDKHAAISGISTMEQSLDTLLAPRRFETALLVLFAVLATLLAAIGVYGSTYYAVSRRMKEIGIRIAMGAQPRSVVSMLIRQTSKIAAAGIGIGLVASLMSTRTIDVLLFGISPTDMVSFCTVPVALMAIGALAALIPAMRAARLDPVVVLRSE